MGIHQQMEFNFFGNSEKKDSPENPKKLAIAEQYLIVPTEENLEKLQEKSDGWYFGDIKVEEWEELHSEADQYWK